MSAAPAAASVFAVELLAELIRRGVADVVVCPGSRSQALALAAAAAEQAGAIRLHVRVDERSAAFFALGVARETGMPAPVIVTSGTAVANLLPAALEAHEGRVPFIAITADRPASSRGTRASQTTEQAHIFGKAARLSLDVTPPTIGENGDLSRDFAVDPQRIARRTLSAALGFPGDAPAGPVQLNLQFTEPLSGTKGFDAMIAAGFAQAGQEGIEARADRKRAHEQGAFSRDTEDGWQVAFTGPNQAASGNETSSEAGTANGAATGAETEPNDDSVYVHGSPESSTANDTANGSANGTAQSTAPLTVVVAGAGAGPEAEAFAHAAGVPLLAEVVSGSRFGREAITAYATLIDTPEIGGLVERAIVFGHPTLTRQIPALLARSDVEVIVVDPHTNTHHFTPTTGTKIVRAARVAAGHDPHTHHRWLGTWIVADRELREARTTVHAPDLEAARETGYKERSAFARAEVAVKREPVTHKMLVERTWLSTWPHDRLVLAASRLVRVLDGLAPARKLTVHANRGLAGIDGTVSTALGIASASQAPSSSTSTDPAQAAGVTRLIIGDIALLHDASSLVLPPAQEAQPRIQIIVGNDGGGTIFAGLEVKQSADPAAFERVMLTPNHVDLEALAKAYGWAYQRITTRVELDRLFTTPVTGPTLVEVPLEQ